MSWTWQTKEKRWIHVHSAMNDTTEINKQLRCWHIQNCRCVFYQPIDKWIEWSKTTNKLFQCYKIMHEMKIYKAIFDAFSRANTLIAIIVAKVSKLWIPVKCTVFLLDYHRPWYCPLNYFHCFDLWVKCFCPVKRFQCIWWMHITIIQSKWLWVLLIFWILI